MKTYFYFLLFLGMNLSVHAITERAAYDIAKGSIEKKNRSQVLSFYGKGTPKEIQTWYIKFYDPETKNKARVAVIENGKLDRFYPAEYAVPPDEQLSFDPASIKAGVETVLKTAEKYTKESQIPYDAVRIYLNRPAKEQAPVWTIELLKGKISQGYIYVTAEKGDLVGYRPPQAKKKKGFSQDVEETFLGIGADLEEFFTGERTVDKD